MRTGLLWKKEKNKKYVERDGVAAGVLRNVGLRPVEGAALDACASAVSMLLSPEAATKLFYSVACNISRREGGGGAKKSERLLFSKVKAGIDLYGSSLLKRTH